MKGKVLSLLGMWCDWREQ